MNIHVTNLNLNLIESDLQRLFTPYGEVKSIELLRDRLNNRSRGSAFINMPVDKEGEKAIVNLHGLQFAGKIIAVAKVPYHGTKNDMQGNGLLL